MMTEKSQKNNVAIDIETTGLQADGAVTVFGMLTAPFDERQAHLVLNSGGHSLDYNETYAELSDSVPVEVELEIVLHEEELLETIQSLLFEHFNREYDRLVAFNGETWRGGFDLPYLRSRYAVHEMQWPFRGCDYVDLYPIVSKRFHTALPDGDELDDHNDLVRSHRFLCQPENEFDPYASSDQAVTDYYDGDFVPLLKHNLSDIYRTADLAEIVQQYASHRQMRTDRL
jgi:uncharacterized protein YprB with RNaseH-like and TPR domain